MTKRILFNGIILDHTDRHVRLEFSHPCRTIGSAVYNGGILQASHIVNLRVEKHSWDPFEPPEETLAAYSRSNGWKGTTVGMMTAASMNSLRIKETVEQGVRIAVLVTTGISNPRRAGDTAEHRLIDDRAMEPGTINTIAVTSAALTEAALVEAIMIVSEAKAAAMQNLGIKSAVSGSIATGTGTDSIVIASGPGPQMIRYCGKHVLFGEKLAQLVIHAISDSVESK